MFRRKLTALNYHQPENYDPKDENTFRNTIVWLEDQKIRHYKIEERTLLRYIRGPDWENAFKKYAEDLNMPDCIPIQDSQAATEWFLGYAIRLEYGDNVEKFKDITPDSLNKLQTSKSSNPLNAMDFESPEFKAGVISLSTLLNIPPYIDHHVVLKAVCLVIKEHLTKEAIEKASKKQEKREKSTPLDQIDLGFDSGDYVCNEAAKILRLLHIKELRDLQTMINQAIVAVQGITANPKTDQRLGKVGR